MSEPSIVLLQAMMYRMHYITVTVAPSRSAPFMLSLKCKACCDAQMRNGIIYGRETIILCFFPCAVGLHFGRGRHG
jgi:hypothetical protein